MRSISSGVDSANASGDAEHRVEDRQPQRRLVVHGRVQHERHDAP